MRSPETATGEGPRARRLFALFLTFLKLGLTSFGGPVAHLGYFRAEFVSRQRWIDDRTFADIVALCQFLPGPSSSQVGIAIGLVRGGLPGAFLAWAGFTLPSAALMLALAYGSGQLAPTEAHLWIHGLLIVAVAIVADAVWGMARRFVPSPAHALMTILAAAASLSFPRPWLPATILISAGVAGRLLNMGHGADTAGVVSGFPNHRWLGRASGTLFLLLLAGLPVMAILVDSPSLALIDRFYRVGALVFGGGHVVLPMLQTELVPRGWITETDFLAGYGAAQAIPGPLFTIAAYLGALAAPGPRGWIGGLLALGAIFLPSFLMLFWLLPLWDRLRQNRAVNQAMAGINAAVVGILLAALYTPVCTSAIQAPRDAVMALAGFAALRIWRTPPWAVAAAITLLARALA